MSNSNESELVKKRGKKYVAFERIDQGIYRPIGTFSSRKEAARALYQNVR